jgi:hypothetical protein
MSSKLRICGLLLLCVAFGGVAAQEKDKKVIKEEHKPRKIELKEGARESFKLTFLADQKVEIRVESEQQTDVDLFVYDESNQQIAADTRGSKDCLVSFTPKKTQVYKVEVVNLGPGKNRCVVYFGAIPAPTTIELKPFDLKEDGEMSFPIRFIEGVKVQIWVDSEKNTDIDLYVYGEDKEKVTSDTKISKDCHVSWTPKKTQVFRVLVVNLGPGDNRCKLRHSVAEEPKAKTGDKNIKKS